MTDTEMETEEPAAVWTKADVRKLLSAMKSQIPQKEAMYSYARGLKTMNWEEVAFLPFSPQACKQKWNDIFKKMRKVRTLTELIVEAEDDFSLLELATGDGASQPPKPPISGYNLFCKEMTNSMKHIPASKYLKVWSQHWRNLSQKQKDGYSSRCRQLKIQYAADVKEYLKQLTEKEQQQYLITNNIKIAKRPKVKFTGEPKMPSSSGYLVFCQYQIPLLKRKIPNVKHCLTEASKIWATLSDKEKEKYKQEARGKQKKYSIKLQKWFETLTTKEQLDFFQSQAGKCQYLDLTDIPLKQESNMSPTLDPTQDLDEATEDSSSSSEVDSLYSEEEEEEEEEKGQDQASFFDMF